MKTVKRSLTALLAVLLTLSLAACNKDGDLDISDNQVGAKDFQQNLHQSAMTGVPTFVETDTGYYVGYGRLYYIEKETMKMTILCGKPDCDHTDPDTCNAMIDARYLLAGGERIYYVSNSNDPKTVGAVKTDATDRRVVQELKFQETSASQSSYDSAIYHRGYIYYISDDVLYRVKLGGEKDTAEEIWKPEGAGSAQSYGDGRVDFNPNAIRYTLWAEGDILYFMANVQTTDGTYKDVLFQCGLDGSDVQQVWVTPGADQVGEWDRAGVSVSQWYVMGGYIYFYLSGGDFWRTELATGKTEKLADTHEQTQYGSAVFSDDHMALLSELPADFYGEVTEGGRYRALGDSIFLYGIDGTLQKDISIEPLREALDGKIDVELLMCDSTDVYFLATTTIYSGSVGNTGSITLWRANYGTGEVTQVYKLR